MKKEELNINNSHNRDMNIKQEFNKRSKESKVVLGIVILLVLYITNTSPTEVIKGISNFWLSITISIFALLVWWGLTKWI